MKTRMLPLIVCFFGLAATLGFGAEEPAAKLPWEKDYAAALEKAKAEKRPIFLMLTAEWCGPCKWLEKNTLPHESIRDGLKEFVWVQAFEDEALNKKFNLSGYPTLVFLNSGNEKPLAQTTGAEAPNAFLKHVLKARRTAGLKLTREMEEMQATSFEPAQEKMSALLEAGDLMALERYLEPVRRDRLRSGGMFLLKVNLPNGVKQEDALAMGTELPKGGLMVRGFQDGTTNMTINVTAPGCSGIAKEAAFKTGEVLISHEVTLRPLTTDNAAKVSGRVLWPDGKPAANAIVRICDWDVTRADAAGRFKFEKVSPGSFLMRAEMPGGEVSRELKFEAGGELKEELTLKPVTTIGIRWALQNAEKEKKLDGPGMKMGEAYFSLDNSRFDLSRGALTRQYWGSDFMLKSWDSKALRQYAGKYAEAADVAGEGAPVFWLFDGTNRKTGLHPETRPFDEIKEVGEAKAEGEERYFEFLRGKPVKKGDVFTVWCVQKDRYAKMEVTDVTIVPEKVAVAK